MKLSFSFRVFLIFFLIVGSLAGIILLKAVDIFESSVGQAAEEVMVDAANLIAELVSEQVEDGTIKLDQVNTLIPAYLQRNLVANIYSVIKRKPDMHVYIVDENGKVIFDSKGKDVGKDYSHWRDVWFTLRGLYGARSSPASPEEGQFTTLGNTLYVAAPIRAESEVIGVVTVSKAVRDLDPFVEIGRRQILTYALTVGVISILFGWLMTYWLARSIRKLVTYAEDLGAGHQVRPPKLKEQEFKRLAGAMNRMQEELEGKQYVENYIHTMAHELKSPLTSIEGAAELLQGDMDADQQHHFLNNIRNSTQRMGRLVDRLLTLASLENRKRLENITNFELAASVNRLLEERRQLADEKRLTVINHIPEDLVVSGESLLIEQALANLLDNALDFTSGGGCIEISGEIAEGFYQVIVKDNGVGIPDYAQQRLFERFFSMPRPESRLRSTGLGLSFVKEVMTLHHGEVQLENRRDSGTKALLRWPVELPKL